MNFLRMGFFAGLGPEPLDEAFTPAFLSTALKGKGARRSKSALLDQRVVAGLGNIYVCEALFSRPASHPSGLAASVAGRASKSVSWPAIKKVLAERPSRPAVHLCATTPKADGELGLFPASFRRL